MVPDSEGTIARHQPGFLTSHDRQKPKKKKMTKKKYSTEQIME